MKVFYRMLLALAIVLCILSDTVNVYSCGPSFATAVFTKTDGPDYSMQSYFDGRLGIVRRQYGPLFLFAAYRYFNGRPLSDSEQAVLMNTPAREVNNWFTSAGYQAWMSARREVTGYTRYVQIPVQADMPADSEQDYLFYVNINDDAFGAAAQTLQKRISQFGAASQAVAAWLKAQDEVFQSEESGEIPRPADPGLPEIIKKDRAYQIASANFYARKFAVAGSLFTAIGQDTSSPYAVLSRYLVARAMIRNVTLFSPNRDSLLVGPEKYLRGLLNDRDMRTMYPAIRRLLQFCQFRTEPKAMFARLDSTIGARSIGQSFESSWGDYMQLDQSISDTAFIHRFDFPDWLNCMDGSYWKGTFAHAYKRWRETRSVPWLVAALLSVDPSSAELSGLLRDAASVPASSPAYPTITYRRIRLLISEGKKAEAGKLIRIMLNSDYAPGSRTYVNLLLSQEAKIASTLAGFLKCCYEKPYGGYYNFEDYSQSGQDSTALFTSEGSVLNRFLPLSVLEKVCMMNLLPPNLQAQVVRATWVRAFLLKDVGIAKELIPLMERTTPQTADFLEEFKSAGNEEARQFAGVFLLMHFPGLQPYVRIAEERGTHVNEIDDYRDNWWCPGQFAIEGSAGLSYSYSSRWANSEEDSSVSAPPFLTKAERERAKMETKELSALPAAPDYLISTVLRWAEAHPGDSRVPEALHLAVRTGHYGCYDSLATKLDKSAFELLHRKYPNSTWAEKTKYYY